MGAWDGAEVCELIGLYMLHKLVNVEKIFSKEEVGLFRDDGLSIIEGNGHMIDKKRKDTIRIFKNEKLKITWEVNITKVCFLDVLFDLQTETYKPYHKANNKLVYVHTGSNHPKLILNNIPLGINRRLSSISSSETCFNYE